MERYEPLDMEVILFETEDVITTSGDGTGNIETPWAGGNQSGSGNGG